MRLDPSSAEAHNNLALALIAAHQPAEAIEHFRDALRLKPEYAEGHIGLGIALSAAGHPREAIEEFELMRRLRPDSIEANSQLARTYAELRQPAAAIAAAERRWDWPRRKGKRHSRGRSKPGWRPIERGPGAVGLRGQSRSQIPALPLDCDRRRNVENGRRYNGRDHSMIQADFDCARRDDVPKATGGFPRWAVRLTRPTPPSFSICWKRFAAPRRCLPPCRWAYLTPLSRVGGPSTRWPGSCRSSGTRWPDCSMPASGCNSCGRSADRYENTPAASAYLTAESPQRLTGYIGYSNDVMWKLWAHLEDAVREGSHRWQQTFGWEGPIFSHFFRTEQAKREFLMGMHGFGVISSPHVVAAFDLSRFRRLVDLGGATGHLAIAACERYPQCARVVFDLADAGPLGAGDRCGVAGGRPDRNRVGRLLRRRLA